MPASYVTTFQKCIFPWQLQFVKLKAIGVKPLSANWWHFFGQDIYARSSSKWVASHVKPKSLFWMLLGVVLNFGDVCDTNKVGTHALPLVVSKVMHFAGS